MASRFYLARVAPLLAASILSACMGSTPSATPDGTPRTTVCDGAARVQLSCETEFQYDARKYEGGFSALGYGVQAKSEVSALHQIDQEVERYVSQARRLCDEYNKCVVDRDTYALRSENLRRRIAKVPELYERVHASSVDVGRRAAIASAYGALVPDDARVELILAVTLLAKRPGESDFTVARPGASLQTDTRIAITVNPSRRAHVYLFQRDARGRINVLFPHPQLPEHNPLAAGRTVRIPSESSYRLNADDIGSERVYIAASLGPLEDLDHGLAALLEGKPAPTVTALATIDDHPNCPDRGLDRAPQGRGLELAPSPAPCLRSRGLELDPSPSGAPASVRMQTEAGDDTLVFSFPFEHVR